MDIGARAVDDVTILDLKGRFVLGEDTRAFRDKLQELVKSGSKNILLNLGGISHMDSSGLGELVYKFPYSPGPRDDA